MRGVAATVNPVNLVQPARQIVPTGIPALDKINLPHPPPFLETPLADQCLLDRPVPFQVNQPLNPVRIGVPNRASAMRLQSLPNIGRHADIETTVSSAGEDIDTRFHILVMEGSERFSEECPFINPKNTASPTHVGVQARDA
jgi:hypothetical protein